MKLAALSLVVLIIGFAAGTWWALESGGVAVVATLAADGSRRSTHVWYAETSDGELWLEAGTPENPWFQDIQQDPQLSFRTEGRSARYLAQPRPGPAGHARIRAMLREKYGLRDRWVGVLVDTSRSVAVRLVPVGGAGPP